MTSGESSWGVEEPDPPVSAEAGREGLWDDWDGLEPGSWEDQVRDAFELDDGVEDPEPEFGDFWPEMDDEGEVW